MKVEASRLAPGNTCSGWLLTCVFFFPPSLWVTKLGKALV